MPTAHLDQKISFDFYIASIAGEYDEAAFSHSEGIDTLYYIKHKYNALRALNNHGQTFQPFLSHSEDALYLLNGAFNNKKSAKNDLDKFLSDKSGSRFRHSPNLNLYLSTAEVTAFRAEFTQISFPENERENLILMGAVDSINQRYSNRAEENKHLMQVFSNSHAMIEIPTLPEIKLANKLSPEFGYKGYIIASKKEWAATQNELSTAENAIESANNLLSFKHDNPSNFATFDEATAQIGKNLLNSNNSNAPINSIIAYQIFTPQNTINLEKRAKIKNQNKIERLEELGNKKNPTNAEKFIAQFITKNRKTLDFS